MCTSWIYIMRNLNEKNYSNWNYVMRNFLRIKKWGYVSGISVKSRNTDKGYAVLINV